MSSKEPPSQSDPRLTPIQLAILTAIRRLTQERHGRPPPMRQVAEVVGRKLTTLDYQYSTLEAKGYLRRQPRHPLTVEVRLPGEPPFGPEAGDPRPYARTETVAWVPIAGQVAAGPPILAEPPPFGGYLPLPREVVGREEGLFILQVRGDSMTGVGINSGDWVVVRQLSQPPRNGDIVAAEIEGVEVEGTVKTYMKEGRDVWLMPHNPAYLPIPGNRANIRGKVVALLRRVDPRPMRRLPGIPQAAERRPNSRGLPLPRSGRSSPASLHQDAGRFTTGPVLALPSLRPRVGPHFGLERLGNALT
jgi:repressor LexA